MRFVSTTRRHLDIAGGRRHNYYTYNNNNIPNYIALTAWTLHETVMAPGAHTRLQERRRQAERERVCEK